MPDVAYEIRPIDFEERAEWEPLWQNYQAFYKVVIPAETTAVTWARLHDPAEPMHALGAYVDGRLRGIVHYLFHRSCWTIGDYCYLQDLFDAEAMRNLGLGRALIAAVEERARAASTGSLRRATWRHAHCTTGWRSVPASFSIVSFSETDSLLGCDDDRSDDPDQSDATPLSRRGALGLRARLARPPGRAG